MMRLTAFLLLLACLAPPAYSSYTNNTSDARDESDSRDKPNNAKPVSDAASFPSCTPGCTTARQACRAQAQRATEDDTSPVLSMNQDTNRYATATREVRPQSQELRPIEAQAFRARRAERLQACEMQYRRCISACG